MRLALVGFLDPLSHRSRTRAPRALSPLGRAGGDVDLLHRDVLVEHLASARAGDGSFRDLVLAGRRLGLGVGVFTMTATWVDGGYINGTAEQTYSSGLLAVQAPWGYALSLLIGGLWFAPVMRRHGFTTLLDPFDRRFGKKAAAVLCLLALTGEVVWTAAILTALGTTFGTILNLDSSWSIVLSAAVVLIYTITGGLWAVALTDVAQLFVLVIGLWIVVPFVS